MTSLSSVIGAACSTAASCTTERDETPPIRFAQVRGTDEGVRPYTSKIPGVECFLVLAGPGGAVLAEGLEFLFGQT